MNKVKIIDGMPNNLKMFINDAEIHNIINYQVSHGVNAPRVLKLEIYIDNAEIETVDKSEIMAKEFARYAREFNKRFGASLMV